MSFADKVTTGSYNFVSLIVKMILIALASSLIIFSVSSAEKAIHCLIKFEFYFPIN